MDLDPSKKLVHVPVYKRGGTLNAYTIIRANPPKAPKGYKGWKDGPEVRISINPILLLWRSGNKFQTPAQDHRLEGYKTTIGPQNFHETKSNKVNPVDAQEKAKRGRPKKVMVQVVH